MMSTTRPSADTRSPAGLNVVGHLGSPSGLGNTTRLFIDVLRSKGYQVAGYDIEPYASSEASRLADGMLKSRIEDLPFENNLVIASIDRLPQLWLRHAKGLLEPRFRNAGLLFWELPTIPHAWLPSLRTFDVVLACSQYVRQAFETVIPEVPTVFVEHPLPKKAPAADRTVLRERFGIPLGKTAYCCSLDLVSGMERKNPLGSLQAWKDAFPTDDDVCLVVKLNGNILSNTDYNHDVNELLESVQTDSRVILVNERLPDEELFALYDCCDVFVSLHRSEGLGLIPMEAMALGKVVVATGYSGNMTFMTEQNSLPVAYRLVAPSNDRAFLSRRFAGVTASWAEPNMQHAVEMLRSAKRPEVAAPLGLQASADIARRQETAWRGPGLDQMFDLLAQSQRWVLRKRLQREILLQEVVSPELRAKNVSKLLSGFGNL